MPALPAVAKVVRVDFHFSIMQDSNAQIREFFQYAGALTQADAQAWCNSMQGAMGTFVGAFMPTGLSHYLTVLTDLSSATAPQASSGTTTAGSLGTQAASAGLALVVKKKIARRYRGGHPKTYLPGIRAASILTSGLFDATFLTNSLTQWNTFVSACLTAVPIAAAPATFVNVSYFQGFTNKTFPSGRVHAVPSLRGSPVVDNILASSFNPVPASQRRRLETP